MAGYFDASILLAAVLDQAERDEFVSIWHEEEPRVSSLLLDAECIISVRRAAALQAPAIARDEQDAWIQPRLAAIDGFLTSITSKPPDGSVLGILRTTPRLAECRTLDAVHLATALWFLPHMDEPLRVCSLDLRLRALARRLGLAVRPESVPGEAKDAGH